MAIRSSTLMATPAAVLLPVAHIHSAMPPTAFDGAVSASAADVVVVDELTSSNSNGPDGKVESTMLPVPKLVMRHVPTGISETAFWASLKDFSDPVALPFRYFAHGRVSRKHVSKSQMPSRAYLVFCDMETSARFSAAYASHVYVDGSGNAFPSTLTPAIYQFMPERDRDCFSARQLSRSRSHSRPHSSSDVSKTCATLDSDPDFIAFVASLSSKGNAAAFARKESDSNLASASTTPSNDNNVRVKDAAKSISATAGLDSTSLEKSASKTGTLKSTAQPVYPLRADAASLYAKFEKQKCVVTPLI